MNSQEINEGLKDFLESDQPTPNHQDRFFVNVFGKLSDMTVGYLISSLAGLFLVLTFLPDVFRLSAAIMDYQTSSAHGPLPGMFSLLDQAFGPSGLLIFLPACAFMLAGVALFNGWTWGRGLLRFLVLYLILVMGAEVRYWASIPPDRTWGNIALLTVIGVMVAMLYRVGKSQNLASIRLLTVVNLVLTAANLFGVIQFFWSFAALPGDRHLHYLSLMFLAVLIMQTIELGSAFLPAWSSGGPCPPEPQEPFQGTK